MWGEFAPKLRGLAGPGALLLIGMLGLVPELRADPPVSRILLTAFEPWAGRKENMSYPIALAIQKNPIWKDLGIEVDVLRLPVVFDRAAHIAEQYFTQQEQKPELVVSLGEAACEIRLETAANNLDDSGSVPDNSGETRHRWVILPEQPGRLGTTLPMQELWCEWEALKDMRINKRVNVDLSSSPGHYVCNNTALHLASFFRDKSVPFGFIHVPPETCTSLERDPVKNGALLARLLARAVTYERKAPLPDSPFPHISQPQRVLPAGRTEAGALLNYVSQHQRTLPACYRDFAVATKLGY